MKKVKVVLSAFAILAVVGSALAFKTSSLGEGTTVFCQASGTVLNSACTGTLVDFKVQTGGTATPCAGISNTTPHIVSGLDCIDNSSAPYVAVDAGK